MAEGNDGMAGNTETDFGLEDGDEVILPQGEDSEESTAVDPFGEEPLNEFLDRELVDDEDEETADENDSSAEDSQEEKSASPETVELLKVIQKQQAREDQLVKELLAIRDGGTMKKDKDEAVLPETFDMDEVPDGFEGITDYLKDMGSKQLGAMKKVYAESQKQVSALRGEIESLRAQIQVGNITRDLNVSPEEDKAIAKWADSLGFTYQGDKIPGIVETYRKLNPPQKGKGKKNPNPPSDTAQTGTTSGSEDNMRRTGETEQDMWSRIEKKALRSLRGDRIPA